MCEEKKCLKGKKKMCACEALKSEDILLLLLHVRENMQDMEWEFEYTTLSHPEPRRLCAAGSCRICGGRLCSSIELDDNATGDDLLAMAYRHLYRYERNMSCKNTESFRERFVGMFREQDRDFVREWLKRQENQSKISNNVQPVQLYTIIRSGDDADRGIFTNPYSEGSFFSRERAIERLAQLVEEEKAGLSEHLDCIEDGEDFWGAYEEGYAAAHFVRLEIVTSELVDSFGGM